MRGWKQGPRYVSDAVKAAVESWSHLDRHAVLGSRGRARVSEQGRAVRARARRLPGRAHRSPAGAARVLAQRSRARARARAGRRRPRVPARKESGPRTGVAEGGDAAPTAETGVPAVGFRRWRAAESPPVKPQVS